LCGYRSVLCWWFSIFVAGGHEHGEEVAALFELGAGEGAAAGDHGGD
jgi:hypothetical protein